MRVECCNSTGAAALSPSTGAAALSRELCHISRYYSAEMPAPLTWWWWHRSCVWARYVAARRSNAAMSRECCRSMLRAERGAIGVGPCNFRQQAHG